MSLNKELLAEIAQTDPTMAIRLQTDSTFLQIQESAFKLFSDINEDMAKSIINETDPEKKLFLMKLQQNHFENQARTLKKLDEQHEKMKEISRSSSNKSNTKQRFPKTKKKQNHINKGGDWKY